MIDGILPVDKPPGWTSHDVVARVRRAAGQRQVGHAGTLDPLATGVLLLVLGSATRLSAYLMATPKVYCAEVVLGVSTVTDDAEAPLANAVPVPSLTELDLRDVLAGFVGEIEQVPPAYAAIKRGGRKLYELARKGIDVQPEPRCVSIERIDLLAWDAPRLRLRVCCGSGTYIRSLARDVGLALGTVGYLHALRRVASGSFTTRDTHPLSDLTGPAEVAAAIEPTDRAVLHLPAIPLMASDERRILDGQTLVLGREESGTVRLYGTSGRLVALGESHGRTVRPIRVFEGRERAGSP